jgi:hypothetical protein
MPAQLNPEAHPDDCIRSGKLRVIPAEVDRVIEIITAEIPLFQLSGSGILSFVAVQSLEEFDTIILWEPDYFRVSIRSNLQYFVQRGNDWMTGVCLSDRSESNDIDPSKLWHCASVSLAHCEVSITEGFDDWHDTQFREV